MGGERTAPSLAQSRRYLANLSDARWAESVREHEGFMAALANRDAPLFAASCKITRITPAKSSAADCARAPRSARQSPK